MICHAAGKDQDLSLIKPGDILLTCGGTLVVYTKGHMPGHISLYIAAEKTLIAGDALVEENGEG